MLQPLLDLIFAPICLSCDARIAAGDAARLVCRACRSRLIALPAPRCARCWAPRLLTGRVDLACAECAKWPDYVRAARSACILAPPADRIMHQFKYRGWKALCTPMAERLALLDLRLDEPALTLVVPVATTPARLRARGYNQAELLAREFARLTGRPLIAALR